MTTGLEGGQSCPQPAFSRPSQHSDNRCVGRWSFLLRGKPISVASLEKPCLKVSQSRYLGDFAFGGAGPWPAAASQAASG